jgi:hypothetical protein
MRRMLWVSAVALLVLPAAAWSQQDQQQGGSQQSQSQQAQSTSASSQNQNPPPPAAPQQDSLAEAARKAREQKKETPKPAKVFTNDNIPTGGGISTIGEAPESGTAQAGGAQAPAGPNDEKFWRDKFAKLRHKLDQDQAELDVMQREIGVAEVQYYGGDPNKAVTDAMSQQPFGSGYTKKLADIDSKKKQVEADKQAIADAEDELHKAGGSPGWAR